MMKNMVILALAFTLSAAAQGQQKRDTVIISLGKTSKVVFTMEDRSDLEILKHYNFQDLFNDILTRIEQNNTDSISVSQATDTDAAPDESPQASGNAEPGESTDNASGNDNDSSNYSDTDDDGDDDWEQKVEIRRGKIGKTWQSFNFDLGTNNYLSKGKFPDSDNAPYSVRPWGSWYVGMSSIQRTRAGRNFFLEWGFGISWYNFKFQNDDVMLVKNDDGTTFVTDTRDVSHRKSKLTVTYLNASLVPVFDLGDRGRKPRLWDGYGNAFRIGFGPYVGYRIASRSKLVYKDDGDLEKEKHRDGFYLNNLRYGARLQLGFRGNDLFFNYDLNELFAEGKGPSLNAFSFGVIF